MNKETKLSEMMIKIQSTKKGIPFGMPFHI